MSKGKRASKRQVARSPSAGGASLLSVTPTLVYTCHHGSLQGVMFCSFVWEHPVFHSPQMSWDTFSTSCLSSKTIHFSRKLWFHWLENSIRNKSKVKHEYIDGLCSLAWQIKDTHTHTHTHTHTYKYRCIYPSVSILSQAWVKADVSSSNLFHLEHLLLFSFALLLSWNFSPNQEEMWPSSVYLTVQI